jgi:uncharacterized protein (TIGR02246 family)
VKLDASEQHFFTVFLSLFTEIGAAGGNQMQSDEQQILQLFEDGDRALIAADIAELSRIFADDYVQYDELGKPSTKQELLERLETGAIRFLSMVSTARRIRLLTEDVAIVHGSEDDEVEQGGKRFNARYVYMDVVVKRKDRWQIVGSQLARLDI